MGLCPLGALKARGHAERRKSGGRDGKRVTVPNGEDEAAAKRDKHV